MNRYVKKQLIIAGFFLLFIGIIVFVGYLIFRPKPEATCFDGIKNQGEEKIDCGGPCLPCEKQKEPIAILKQKIISMPDNNFDFVAEVSNPNEIWGARSVGYVLNIFNQENEVVFSKEASFYILPQEKKYIVEPKIALSEPPQKFELVITSTNWQRLDGFRDLALRIRDKKIQFDDYTRISGTVSNNTSYDFDKVELVGLIFDQSKEIIAAGKTDVRTLLRGENRYFEIRWPKAFNVDDFSYEIMPYTNVFLPENLIDVKKQQDVTQ